MMNRFSIFLAILTMSVPVMTFAQETSYVTSMQRGVEQLSQAASADDMKTVSHIFETLADQEPDQWLPGYYLAYSLSMQSLMEVDGEKKDSLLDQAQDWIDNIQEIAPEESEILVLQALIYQARIQVDMMARGPEMTMLQVSVLSEAEHLNPDNPRIYLLKGQNTYYTPEFFGGGAEAAKPILELAREKFESFEPDNELSPVWGGDRLTYLLAQYE